MKHMKGTAAVAGLAASLLFAGVAGADAFHTDLATNGRIMVVGQTGGTGGTGGAGQGGAAQGGSGGATQSDTEGTKNTPPDAKAPECKCDPKAEAPTPDVPAVPGLPAAPKLPGVGG